MCSVSDARANLGVLLVHGIGEQAKGQTLARFGDPLITLILEWSRRAPGDTVATLTAGSSSAPTDVDPRQPC